LKLPESSIEQLARPAQMRAVIRLARAANIRWQDEFGAENRKVYAGDSVVDGSNWPDENHEWVGGGLVETAGVLGRTPRVGSSGTQRIKKPPASFESRGLLFKRWQ
jgi:hypothetical protein